MIDDDMWVLWRLSTQKKLDDNNFECSLILESSDCSPLEVIDVNVAEIYEKTWLRLVRKEAPFDSVFDIETAIENKSSLYLTGFIDIEALIIRRPKLAYVYLWASASARNEKVHLETVYPLSNLTPLPSLNLNKVFLQIYPILSENKLQQRYNEIEGKRVDSEGLEDLLVLIKNNLLTKKNMLLEKNIATNKPIDIKKSITKPEVDQNSFDIEMLDSNDVDSVWGIFAKQDLDDLVEGFNDWQRVHGKNTLIARLPKRLANKLGGEFNVVFWTSGQGISNMIVDDKPPRHTMVLGITNRSGDQSIGYCIQRPTSLDKMWTHQKWHSLECSNSEILRVEPVNF